ncbi:MAG: tRNA pseudouridine(38-40) synthase TruA [Candidatus Omnitrophica bacterium]|nr:tRNA pseudouridine(38-40) synthase TruA [Candidatus Omnitrophota bacterium]
MRNIKLTIEYDGTDYSGWQSQPCAKTVQGTIEKALKDITQENLKLTSCSRTDKGVHARAHIANFKTSSRIPATQIQRALNAKLPEDISISEAKEVPLKFHAQRDVKRRIYHYSILNQKFNRPITKRFSYHMPYRLDFNLMRREARALIGRHDFKAFQAKDNRERSSIRRIKKIVLIRMGDFIDIEMEADGFLYNMARIVVGTLIEIGRGKFPPGSMKKILKSRDRTKAGPTVPPMGLILSKVIY